MKIKKLNLQTAYLKTLQEFYSSILELPVRSPDEKKINIKIGAGNLVFTETTKAEPFYHFAINIPANKIEEAKDWLSNKVRLLWMEDYENDIDPVYTKDLTFTFSRDSIITTFKLVEWKKKQ